MGQNAEYFVRVEVFRFASKLDVTRCAIGMLKRSVYSACSIEHIRPLEIGRRK
jgi:hypothetical protein